MATHPRRATARLRTLSLAATIGVCAPVFAGTPLLYTTTIAKPDGSPEAVTFVGTADGGNVSGTVQVHGVTLKVDGTIVGDEFRGAIRSQTGEQLGTIAGKRDRDGFTRGTTTFGLSVAQSWELPVASVSPTAATRPTDASPPAPAPATLQVQPAAAPQ